MTIQVQREALLRVLDRPRVSQQHDSSSSSASFGEATVSQESYRWIDFCQAASWSGSGDDSVGKLRRASSDDEDSVVTESTASLSDSDSIIERRVSFAEDLVTHEWTRPFTPKEEINNLFYTTEETQRFRQEYRMERKLLAELSIDPETFPVDNEELSLLLSQTSSGSGGCGQRHRISRVVVLHNDKLETFYNPEDACPTVSKKAPSTDDFFDNDSFWSGSITWY